ncbi:hypothetical protein [Pedobacter chitinilyticus]|uniref:Uncharacterized protein n=1 Tax=Pedobacter chitinilyticus TaxID=2233776 RepID=A0A443YUA3_9SPHI|nr:hypothetical protein [Pedobacter chitinilyticus]RWU07415.1 hypothetical protein DPV69_10510 [Pedobacter chitinilyticus]
MATLITLDIFSGRPNPTWELSDEQAKILKEKLYSLREKSLLKSPSILYGLGYRGFIVSSVGDPDLPQKMLVNANIVDFGWTRESYVDHQNDIEKWLLDTSGSFLDDEIKKIALEEIDVKNKSFESTLKSKKDTAKVLVEPPYNPGWWNNDASRLRSNNCYNYGSNFATNTFAQPGRGSGRMYAAISCAEVSAAAARDGLISIPNVDSTPADGHYVALVVGPNWDFHWYRRDNNGMWSHKPGGTPVINYDQSGNLISDPRYANRGRYTDFCGFYHVIPSRIRIL